MCANVQRWGKKNWWAREGVLSQQECNILDSMRFDSIATWLDESPTRNGRRCWWYCHFIASFRCVACFLSPCTNYRRATFDELCTKMCANAPSSVAVGNDIMFNKFEIASIHLHAAMQYQTALDPASSQANEWVLFMMRFSPVGNLRFVWIMENVVSNWFDPGRRVSERSSKTHSIWPSYKSHTNPCQ